VLIVGGVLLTAAVIVAILLFVGGEAASTTSTTRPNASASARAAHARARSHARHTSTGASSAASPAETSVVVLNGTETAGLAHAVSNSLRQNGYVKAKALNGRPAGANQVSVVEYARGDRAEAEGVARAISVTQVQPLEPATASLSGPAMVAVIVGLDKAASVP
jgi:hypothetical protein